MVGLNHRTAPLEVRERLTPNSDGLPEALETMASYGVPGVILSTCNRSEFYALEAEATESRGRDGEQRIKSFLVEYFDIPLVEVERYLYLHREQDCINHLFRVASSLDSMVPGEDQIIGQVREAFEAAVRAATAHGQLYQLFQEALRVGRRVRRETGIGKNSPSMSRACVDLAKESLGDLSGLRAMVVGAGDAGGLAAEVLKLSGVKDITVTNRTYQRAQELASTLSGRAMPFRDMPEGLRDADLVIACTGSPGYVLAAETVRTAMAWRPERPLFMIDIAVPRDIEPAAGQINNVRLHDVDDLEAVSESGRREKAKDIQRAEDLVARETERFLEWCLAQRALPTVIALREKAEKIRETELRKTIRKLDLDLDSDQKEAMEAMTQAIVKKLLHGPTVYLKEHRDTADFRLAREFFQLPNEEP